MKKTTPDLETPIFRELNKELGALPEIDIHDFDQHAFDFLREYDAQAQEETSSEAAAEPVAAASAASGSKSKSGSRRGGRRRKGD